MTLSEKAWAHAAPIVEAIYAHPFNQELAQGTLDMDAFAYYIEQDSLYLQDFARCHAILASKMPTELVRPFIRYAEYTFITEQELVHEVFKKTFGFKETGKISPATFNYTNYLLRTCALEPVEVGVASILPCFWVYREVGRSIIEYAHPENPFFTWIQTYASPEFSESVDEAIAIFDAFADKTSEDIRQRMVQAFRYSTLLEWHFWNDAYHQASLHTPT